eukprot:scaffold611805_cov15-Prasinocladus_malaysianus.AAC.1
MARHTEAASTNADAHKDLCIICPPECRQLAFAHQRTVRLPPRLEMHNFIEWAGVLKYTP